MRETLRQKVNKFIGQKFGEFVKAQIIGSNKLCEAYRDNFCAVSYDAYTITYVKQTTPTNARDVKPEILFRYDLEDPHCVLVRDENEKQKYRILLLNNSGKVIEKVYLEEKLFKKSPHGISTSITYSAKFNTVTWWYDSDPVFAAMLAKEI